MMKKLLCCAIVLALLLTALAGCGRESAPAENGASDVYASVMARFDGKLEEGTVLKVLENDTAIELGYVDALIEAFNEAYRDKGISAERMNVDQYSDLATDGPYGYGPDVWYQANDILMKYADNQHLLPLPVRGMECWAQIPQSAWDAYAKELNGEVFYCGVPLNVQSGMLYYIESSLPENWREDWDINKNDVPDFFVFGGNGRDPKDIGLNAGEAVKGARMIRQWAGEMNNTEVLDNSFSSAAYQYLANRTMLCTVTTPDVRQMFRRAMVYTGNWTEEEAERDLKLVTVPRLPVSGDLTADAWQDTITNMDSLTVETTMMGGINGYGISAYTEAPNASLAFVEFAASYEQVLLRNQYLGISPARADAAAAISENDRVAGMLFDRLDRGAISIMPAITETGQIWTPTESFLVDLSTDPYREARGEKLLFATDAEIQAGLDRLVGQIRDAIETLA